MINDYLLVLGAYLYGSTPFVWGIARLKGANLRHHGSQNVGPANLAQAVGSRAGILGGICDFSKGLLPIVIGHYLLDSSLTVLCLAAIAALVGQMWPIFLRFFGGRGNSVSGRHSHSFHSEFLSPLGDLGNPYSTSLRYCLAQLALRK